MLKSLSKLFDTNQRELDRIQPLVQTINSYETKFKKFKTKDFPEKTAKFKLRLTRGETLDDLLPEAFALVRQASVLTLGLRHFDVQLIAGVAFHKGMVAEQKTGEGKTLSATLALYLNALTGKGAHLVTVNDYLAQRDAGWNAPLYNLLGLSVGVIIPYNAYLYDSDFQGPDRGDNRLEHLRPVSRQQAYAADITYGTSSEFGFDYLRDNMSTSLDQVVQRGHHFAIVDEVDSILIDEARTPLIISAPDSEPTEKYFRFKNIVQSFSAQSDYEIDEKLRTASLTDYGIKKLEKHLGVNNLYEKDYDTLHHIEQALKAKTLFHRDKQYVVKEDQVIIVDEHTGRLMHGRRYSDGLHQAIEAKEDVQIQKESKTLATVSIQNYFRMYTKLAGMTGTAATEAEEFSKIYDIEVLVVPTNRPIARTDHPDVVYKTTRAKYGAIVKEVKNISSTGQPVLLGTRSIEHNEIIHKYLKRMKVPHQLLNAKNHQKEAHIIANAGKPGAVTVATNIAGRGVDIVLGGALPEDKTKTKALNQWKKNHQLVIKLGGLHVIGTERHESRRIDNQLRGRSGRQGDPGSSRFFVALDDEIMRIFGGEQVAKLMTALKIPEDQPIEASMVSRSIAQAQTKVEGFHFDQRKHLVEYDDVLNKQREIIYKKRNFILSLDPQKQDQDLHQRVLDILFQEIDLLVHARAVEGLTSSEIQAIIKEFCTIVPFDKTSQTALTQKLSSFTSPAHIISTLTQVITDLHQQRIQVDSSPQIARLEQFTLLRTIDELWIDHLDNVEDLRQGIWLRGSQEQALSEYKKEAFELFERLIGTIDAQVARRVFRTRIATSPSSSVNLDQAITTHQPLKTQVAPSDAGVDQDKNPFAAALARTVDKPLIKERGIKHRKIGRNHPCWCGSGKKWKKCHYPEKAS